jgi:hypothetical protein
MGIDGADIKAFKEKKILQPRAEIKEREIVKPVVIEKERPPEQVYKPRVIQIDCHACKLPGGMRPDEVPRFSGLVRLIGFILALPSALGMLLAAFVAISSQIGMFGLGGGDQALSTFMAALFIFCTSLVFGVVGWILLMKKKVFKCRQCGFILDRA